MNNKKVAQELVKIAKIISAVGWEPDEVADFQKTIEFSREKYRKALQKGLQNANKHLGLWFDTADILKRGSGNPKDGEEYEKIVKWVDASVNLQKTWYNIFRTSLYK